MRRTDYSSCVILIPPNLLLPVGQVKNRIHQPNSNVDQLSETTFGRFPGLILAWLSYTCRFVPTCCFSSSLIPLIISSHKKHEFIYSREKNLSMAHCRRIWKPIAPSLNVKLYRYNGKNRRKSLTVYNRNLKIRGQRRRENVAEKVNWPFCNLHRDCSKLLTLSNVGELS